MSYSTKYAPSRYDMSSRGLKTSGTMWHQHTMVMGRRDYDEKEKAILTCLTKVFGVKDFTRSKHIECWYDEMVGLGRPGESWFNGAYIFGVFYTKDPLSGRDALTHFFVRKIVDFTGTLDGWRDDLTFPDATRIFSACAVFPKGFEIPSAALFNCHNQQVSQYRWERLEDLGVPMDLILQKMKAPENYWAIPPHAREEGDNSAGTET